MPFSGCFLIPSSAAACLKELESKREHLSQWSRFSLFFYVMFFYILSTAAIGKDAGDLALKPTTVDTFFYGMKPRYPEGRGYELYQNQRLGQAICAFNSYVILRMSCSSWITKSCYLEFPPGSLPQKINTPHHLFEVKKQIEQNKIWVLEIHDHLWRLSVETPAPKVHRRAPPNPDPTQRGTPRRPGVGTDDQARGTTDRPTLSQVAQLRAITPYLGYW